MRDARSITGIAFGMYFGLVLGLAAHHGPVFSPAWPLRSRAAYLAHSRLFGTRFSDTPIITHKARHTRGTASVFGVISASRSFVMQRLMTFIATASLAVGGLAFVGCESTLPPDERGAYAGGNGAFGENPVKPGAYTGGSSQPATQPSQSTAHLDSGY